MATLKPRYTKETMIDNCLQAQAGPRGLHRLRSVGLDNCLAFSVPNFFVMITKLYFLTKDYAVNSRNFPRIVNKVKKVVPDK